jgi:hypothetical protein
MSEEKSESEELSFGEKLLGMQGFSAARAQRYRAELEKLLVQRITGKQRWVIGMMGIYMLLTFGIVAVVCAIKWEQPSFPISSEMRWTFAVSCMSLGLLFSGWFLRVAFQGGFSRRLGDMMGVAILLVFCGSLALFFFMSESNSENDNTRVPMLLGGGTLVACTVGCVVLSAVQCMHRQTQEKLLRIEYHVAELMERSGA